jgi:lysophospholipase L1-like esterase
MIEFIQKTGFFGDGGATPEPPLPEPTTVNFTSAQYAAGLTGSVSTTKNAARIYMRGAITLWSGFISGTEAKLTSPSDFGDQPGSMQVAIDGGAFTLAPNTGSVYTLFTGLPHATRFVEVRYDAQMGEAPYIAATGNVLEVTGQPPALVTLPNKVQNGADSATGFYSGAQVANAATFTPPLQAQTGQNYGSNVGCIKIRGAFTQLAVTVNGARKIAVSKNGGAPSFYEMTDDDDSVRAIRISCDGSTSTYYVWDNGNYRNGNGHLAVAGNSTLLDVGTRRRLDQLPGDSITFGSGPGATSRDTETMRVAAAMGFVGSTNGISGLTISGGSNLLDVVLPARTVTSSDVAVLAIGGNSAAEGIDGPEQAAYAACIDKLLAKGYGKVLCRGILPNVAAQPLVDAANVTLKSVMDGKADARLVWIDTTSWAFSTIDGTHPDAAGYATLAGYAVPAYTAALGL